MHFFLFTAQICWWSTFFLFKNTDIVLKTLGQYRRRAFGVDHLVVDLQPFRETSFFHVQQFCRVLSGCCVDCWCLCQFQEVILSLLSYVTSLKCHRGAGRSRGHPRMPRLFVNSWTLNWTWKQKKDSACEWMHHKLRLITEGCFQLVTAAWTESLQGLKSAEAEDSEDFCFCKSLGAHFLFFLFVFLFPDALIFHHCSWEMNTFIQAQWLNSCIL